MNIWNLSAGIASIVSLIFHLSGKGATLRQFTLPTTAVLVGYTIDKYNAEAE